VDRWFQVDLSTTHNVLDGRGGGTSLRVLGRRAAMKVDLYRR
jgi:hypothetical protein